MGSGPWAHGPHRQQLREVGWSVSQVVGVTSTMLVGVVSRVSWLVDYLEEAYKFFAEPPCLSDPKPQRPQPIRPQDRLRRPCGSDEHRSYGCDEQDAAVPKCPPSKEALESNTKLPLSGFSASSVSYSPDWSSPGRSTQRQAFTGRESSVSLTRPAHASPVPFGEHRRCLRHSDAIGFSRPISHNV